MKKNLPIIGLGLLIIVIFYWKFFLQGLLPVPADLLPGAYFPWLDIKYSQYPIGIPIKNPFPSDIVSLTYPLRKLSIDILKQGQLPLWNPNILSGTPLLANFQSAALYPLNLIYFFIDNFSLAWSLQVILQPVLAFLFMYLFLKNNRLNSLTSLFGAISWSFCGFFSIWMQYNTLVHTALYLPLALFSIQNIPKNALSGLWLSLSIVFSFLAGYPITTLMLILSASLYCLFIYTKPKHFIIASVFTLIGTIIISPLILSTIKYNQDTVRTTDQVATSANIKYLPPKKLITFLVPDYFGNPSTGNYWGNLGSYDNLTVYAGIIPLALAFLAIFSKKKDKLTQYSLFLLIVSLILTIKNPVSTAIGNLSFMGLSAMVMTRFSLLTNFSIAILAAIGLKNIITQPNRKLFLIFSIFFALCLLTLAIAILQVRHLTIADPIGNQFFTAIRNSALPLAIIATCLILSLFTNSKYKQLVIILLIIISQAELYRFFYKYNSFVPDSFIFPQTATTDYLQQNSTRFAAEPAEIIPSNTWLPYGLKSISGQDTLHSLRYNQFISLLNGGNLTDTNGSRYVSIQNFDSPLINFLGVDYFVAIKRTEGKPSESGKTSYKFDQFPVVFEDGRVAIHHNKEASPLIFPVKNYLLSLGPDQTQELLLTENLAQTVILEQELPDTDITLAIPQLKNINIQSQSVEFDSQSDQDGFIVHTQTFHPNWKLYIDNQLHPIYIANHAFIGFLVPKGEHHIKLKFTL